MRTKDSQPMAYVKLVRPKHWLKNILVFVPILYAQNLNKTDLLMMAIQCFIAFCLISSVVYIVNDIADFEKDRQHPVKCKRPIAAGQINVRKAITLALALSVAGFSLSLYGYNNYVVFLFAVIYVLLNLAYSFALKHYPLIDCFIIATGFVLRIYAGAAASKSYVSEWLFLTIVVISLFMAFGKRRGEIMQIDFSATRSVLSGYDVRFMNGIVFVCAGLSIVFYALWALENNSLMIYTVPLVIFIICKYLMTLYANQAHGDPITILFSDKGLLVSLLLFCVISIVILYL